MPSCSIFGCINLAVPIPWRNAVQNHQKKVVGPLPADKGFYISAEHFEESFFEKDLKVGQK